MNLMIRNSKNSRFTLIELLVVISVIVFLAAALGLGVLGVLKRAEFARAESNILAIESALKQYVGDWKTLPPIGTFPEPPDTNIASAEVVNSDLAIVLEAQAGVGVNPIKWTVGPYITPNRGMTKNDSGYYEDPWGTAYIIRFPGLDHTAEALPGVNNTNWVDILSLGPNAILDATEDDDDDVCNYRRTTK